MTTVTIPKELAKKGDLVLIPRSEYEEFLNWQRTYREFVPTAAERAAVVRARKNFAAGNYLTLHELRKKLGIKS